LFAFGYKQIPGAQGLLHGHSHAQFPGEFTTGDYLEIMNKASALSLVSNAILYWNTSRISNIVDELRNQGETVDDNLLAHISLLPYKHVLPNGTYFIKHEETK
uniref:Tn3 family transposase n=1 Tax=Shewanella sp. TaxID=50422 RepID=UPI0040478B15